MYFVKGQIKKRSSNGDVGMLGISSHLTSTKNRVNLGISDGEQKCSKVKVGEEA